MTAISEAARPVARTREVEPGARPEDHQLQLTDGRRLGWSESGDPSGTPVFFFHGFGTTRIVCPPDEAALEHRIRLIAVDRPGIGLSDPQPGRSLLDWPSDVAELADHLGFARFSIVAWSGGGPYGLACGHALASRVDAVAAVSPAAPLAKPTDPGYLRWRDRHAVRFANRAPWVIRLAMWHWGRGQRALQQAPAAGAWVPARRKQRLRAGWRIGGIGHCAHCLSRCEAKNSPQPINSGVISCPTLRKHVPCHAGKRRDLYGRSGGRPE